jgi:hypothetical protein
MRRGERQITDAQTQQATDERRSLARLVIVETAIFMGQDGAAVRNASPTGSVHEIEFDFPGSNRVVVISASGTRMEEPPVEIPLLRPGQTTGDKSVLQKLGGADGRTLIREARIRFRDGRDLGKGGGCAIPVAGTPAERGMELRTDR